MQGTWVGINFDIVEKCTVGSIHGCTRYNVYRKYVEASIRSRKGLYILARFAVCCQLCQGPGVYCSAPAPEQCCSCLTNFSLVQFFNNFFLFIFFQIILQLFLSFSFLFIHKKFVNVQFFFLMETYYLGLEGGLQGIIFDTRIFKWGKESSDNDSTKGGSMDKERIVLSYVNNNCFRLLKVNNYYSLYY